MATRLDAVLEHVELSPPLANWPARVGVSDYQRGDWPAGSRWRASSPCAAGAPQQSAHFCRRSLADGQGRLASGSDAPGAQRSRQPAPQTWLDRWRAAAVARVTRAAGEHTQRRAHRADYRRAGLYPARTLALVCPDRADPSGQRLRRASDLAGRPGGQRHHLAVAAANRWRARRPGWPAQWLAIGRQRLWAAGRLVAAHPAQRIHAVGAGLGLVRPLSAGRRPRLGAGAVRGADAGPFAALSLGFWLSFSPWG